MKIIETIERECCLPTKDFRQYMGNGNNPSNGIKFCIHCGQQWEWVRKPGEMDAGWERVEVEP